MEARRAAGDAGRRPPPWPEDRFQRLGGQPRVGPQPDRDPQQDGTARLAPDHDQGVTHPVVGGERPETARRWVGRRGQAQGMGQALRRQRAGEQRIRVPPQQPRQRRPRRFVAFLFVPRFSSHSILLYGIQQRRDHVARRQRVGLLGQLGICCVGGIIAAVRLL